MLRGILPDQRFVGFHLGADRGIGITAAPAAEQGNRTAQQHNDQDNHHGNPAPGHQNGDQRLCTGDDRLNCGDSGFGRGLRSFCAFSGCGLCRLRRPVRGFCSGLGGFLCRPCRDLGGFHGGAGCLFRRLDGTPGRFDRTLCGFYRGFSGGFCRLPDTFAATVCGIDC